MGARLMGADGASWQARVGTCSLRIDPAGLALFAAVVIALALASAAQAKPRSQPHAHSHGAATLTVVQDAKKLQVELEAPMADLVGFEHQPRNLEERQALAAAIKSERFQGLLQLNGEAQCGAEVVRVALGTAKVAAHSHHASGSEHSSEHSSEHQDIRVTWSWQCSQPERLQSLAGNWMQVFKGTKQLRATSVVNGKQAYKTLTPGDSRLPLQ